MAMKYKNDVSPYVQVENAKKSKENTEYIASMLSELKQISRESEDEMLTYLIEIAEAHANDIMIKKQK